MLCTTAMILCGNLLDSGWWRSLSYCECQCALLSTFVSGALNFSYSLLSIKVSSQPHLHLDLASCLPSVEPLSPFPCKGALKDCLTSRLFSGYGCTLMSVIIGAILTICWIVVRAQGHDEIFSVLFYF